HRQADEQCWQQPAEAGPSHFGFLSVQGERGGGGSCHRTGRPAQGGEVGRISWYSELSSASPRRAATISRSSAISPRVETLRHLVTNRPARGGPASCCSPLTSSAGASPARKPRGRPCRAFSRRGPSSLSVASG